MSDKQEKHNPLAEDDDFFIPTSSIRPRPPMTYTEYEQNQKDIAYFHHNLARALKIPLQYLLPVDDNNDK